MRTEIGRGGASGPGGPGWGSLLWRCRMTQRTRRGGSWWHLAPQGSPLGHWGGYCAFRGLAIAQTGAQSARVTSVFHRGATRVLSRNPGRRKSSAVRLVRRNAVSIGSPVRESTE